MPNRILKDSICTSESVDALSAGAEVFFYRLIVQCDDYGRFDARPAVLRARCFPLRIETVTTKDIAKWLAELVKTQTIVVYTVHGKPYLQFTRWDDHQQVRAKRSKYPAPCESDNTCNQVIADVSNSPRNPIHSESESESESKAESKDAARKAPHPPLSPQVQVYLANNGVLPKGKLRDGTNKEDKAAEYITARVRPDPASLALWGRVVAGYTAQWSAHSYTTMVTEFYEKGRIPGEANKPGSNGHAGKVPPAQAAVSIFLQEAGIGEEPLIPGLR